MSFDVPVLFIIFNRIDTTAKVFNKIREIKPKELFISADGPRINKFDDNKKCKETRDYVLQNIDWDCNLHTLFNDNNLGCKYAIINAINWFFENVEEGIILEDDCLPNSTFFDFCKEMLSVYRYDSRIMRISGTNLLGEWKSNIQDYHFSYYGGNWGWASWKRAWKYFDPTMKLWEDEEVRKRIKDIVCNDNQYRMIEKNFNTAYDGKIDAWDYQWLFNCMSQSGISIVPSINLISNIGFGENATHTFEVNSNASSVKTGVINYPYRINKFVIVDKEFDNNFAKISGWEITINKIIKEKFIHFLNIFGIVNFCRRVKSALN